MGYSVELASRINVAVNVFSAAFTQKKMFGGIAFLYKGKMTVGVINDDLMVRIIADKMKEHLQYEYVRPMDFTGTPMKEFLFISPKGYETEEQLQYWIELGWEHAKYKLNE